MKINLLRTSAAAAIMLGFGLTASVAAEEPGGAGQESVEQPARAPQDDRATVGAPGGADQLSATVERQQVSLGNGETVTVLRPVVAAGAKASGQEEDVQRQTAPTWQVAAGRRLWLIDPVSGDLRTCAVLNTSTVGVAALSCLSASGSRFSQLVGPTLAP